MKIIKFIFSLMLIPSLCFGAASRSYDGTNDNIAHGTSSTLNLTGNDSSVAVWVRPNTTTNFPVIFIKRPDANNWGRCGWRVNAPEFYCSYREGGSQLDRSTPDNSVTNNVWTFGVFQWDTDTGSPGTPSIYVNNVVQSLNSESGFGGGTADGFFTGERSDGLSDFTGFIAHLLVYQRELTAVERAELIYKPEMIPSGNTMFAPYFGDSTETDLSGNGLTGTVTGATGSNDGPPVMFGGGLPL